MATVNFKRKKQALEFIINELAPMKEKIRELEQSVDQKFIETVGYALGISYDEQYGHDCLYTNKHKKAIIPNIKRTLLWDINYAINKHIKELEFNILYLEFVKKYGHMFDTYSDGIKAFHEFVDNGTTPAEKPAPAAELNEKMGGADDTIQQKKHEKITFLDSAGNKVNAIVVSRNSPHLKTPANWHLVETCDGKFWEIWKTTNGYLVAVDTDEPDRQNIKPPNE